MIAKLVGKKNGSFEKEGKQVTFCKLFVLKKDQYTEGYMTDEINTTAERGAKLQLNEEYYLLFDKGFDGKARMTGAILAKTMASTVVL